MNVPARSTWLILALAVAPLAAQDVPSPEELAFVEVTTPRPSFVVGQPIDITVRFGLEAHFLAENLVQTFPRRLSLPVRIDAPWLEELGRTRLLGTPPGSADAASRSCVLNDELAEAAPAGERTVGGRRFLLFAISRRFLAEQAGELIVPAPTLRFSYAARFEENFFGDRVPVDRRDAHLVGSPLTLAIEPLPTDGQPEDFGGAVGRFTVSATATPRDVAVGDSLKLELTIEGDGNLTSFEAPSLDRLPGFHARGRIEDIGTARRVVTYDLAVLSVRATTLPPIELPYLDPGPPPTYRRAVTEPIPLMVRPAADGTREITKHGVPIGGVEPPDAAEPVPATATPLDDQEPAPGVDVLFGLKELVRGDSTGDPTRPLGPAAAALGLLLPWLLAAGFVALRRARRRLAARAGDARIRAAAARFLTSLDSPGGDRGRALAGYVAIRARCSTAAVIDTGITRRLEAAGVDADLAARTERVLDILMAARFGGTADEVPDDAELRGLVTALESRFEENGGRP